MELHTSKKYHKYILEVRDIENVGSVDITAIESFGFTWTDAWYNYKDKIPIKNLIRAIKCYKLDLRNKKDAKFIKGVTLGYLFIVKYKYDKLTFKNV